MNTSLLGKISIGIASLALSSMACAAMDMDSRVTQLENQMQQVRTKTPMGTYGAKTATARAEVDGYGWYLAADVLVWHAKLGGTDYVYKVNGSSVNTPLTGSIKDVSFDWDWGVRVGLGYNFKHDGWDMGLFYTYFKTDDTDSVSTGRKGALVPQRGAANLANIGFFDIVDPRAPFQAMTQPSYREMGYAENSTDITYNNLELELGRAYYVSSKLSLRPHWGVRTSWINLDPKVIYRGNGATAATGNTTTPTVNTSIPDDCPVFVSGDSDFWGIGPRVGANSKWYLGNGVSIFGNVSGALLYGFFDVDFCNRIDYANSVISDSDATKNRLNLDADRHFVVPTVQLLAGLRYDAYLNNNKQHFGIGLGYEINYWWRVNQTLYVNDFASTNFKRFSEDMAFYGITLSLKLDF